MSSLSERIAGLTMARDRVHKMVDLAGKRIAANWDKEAKVFRNREEVNAMHAIVNEGLAAWYRIGDEIEFLEAELTKEA